ncbi:P-loop NTPase fold protein [Acidobacteriota bacterium]
MSENRKNISEIPFRQFWIWNEMHGDPSSERLSNLSKQYAANISMAEKTIAPGDVVYIWNSKKKGIQGWGLIDSQQGPVPVDTIQLGKRIEKAFKLDEPITKKELERNRWLRYLPIFRYPQATLIPINCELAIVLNNLILDKGQEVPPEPSNTYPIWIANDYELSATTQKVFQDANKIIPSVPMTTTSQLLLGFIQIGANSKRANFDTSRFLAQQIPDHFQIKKNYKATWEKDTEIAEVKSSTEGRSMSRAVCLVLAASERLAIAITGKSNISLRHLLGALLESEPPSASPGAQQLLKDSDIDILALRREFLKYLRQYQRGDAIGEWEKFLLSPDEQVNMLPGYASDIPEGNDLLDFSNEVDALASLIASTKLEPPLSIGLFGDWGSGKSFFMNKLIDRVNWISNNVTAPKDGGKPNFYKKIVQIEFNAWHYSESTLWASLVTHIFDNLRLVVDKPETIEKRREWVMDELEHKKRMREKAEDNLKNERRSLGGKKGALTKAKQEAERKRKEFIKTTSKDAVQAIKDTKAVEMFYNYAQNILGLESLGATNQEIQKTIKETRAVLGETEAVWKSIKHSDTRSRRIIYFSAFVGITIVFFLIAKFLQTRTGLTFIADLRGLLAPLLGILGAFTPWFRTHLKKAREALEKLKEADLEFSRRLEQEQSSIDKEMSAREEELKEQEMRVREHEQGVEELEISIKEIEADLRDLEPDRRFAKFISERALSQDYRKELGILALIRQDFERLTEFLSTDGRGKKSHPLAVDRIILYIDDLDRCPKDKVIKVLQAVHLLLAFKLFVVVVAVDARWVRSSLANSYEQLIADNRPHISGSSEHLQSNSATTEDYLEKIFQVPLWIKPMDETGAKAIVNDLLKEDLESISEATDRRRLQSERRASVTSEDAESTKKLDEIFEALDQTDKSEIGKKSTQFPTSPNWILQPERLELIRDELGVIRQLAPLIGRSPRAVKRFVNVYRIMRAGLHREELSAFLGEGDASPEFPATIFLLATLNGSPAIATEIFRQISTTDTTMLLSEFLQNLEESKNAKPKSEWGHFFELVGVFNRTWGERLKISVFHDWASRIARFSFRMEMVEEMESRT